MTGKSRAGLFPKSGRIESIESLRAMAAFAILAFHAAFISGLAQSDSAVAPYASRLEVGVTIFFLISGFLLYRPFVRSRVLGTRPPWIARYVVSRGLRIVPAYWVALAVIAVWLSVSGVLTSKGIVTYFGFLQVYGTSTFGGGLVQAWSLCVEIVFYAFLPLYALLLRSIPGRNEGQRLRTEWIGIAALFIVGTTWNALVLSAHDPSLPSSQPFLLSFPAFLDQFAIGMGLAVLVTSVEANDQPRPWLGALDRLPGLAIGLSAIAFWAAATQIGLSGGEERISGLEWEARHLLFALVALGLMLPAILGHQDRGHVRRALRTRPGRWLGDVSYGIFLWHLAFLTALDRAGFAPAGGATAQWVEWIVVAAIPTTIIAAGSWYLLERPSLSLRDRFTRIPRVEAPHPPEVALATAESDADAAAP
jgi:peptidoglycan/LPS O-acetylase OafA/YrhL